MFTKVPNDRETESLENQHLSWYFTAGSKTDYRCLLKTRNCFNLNASVWYPMRANNRSLILCRSFLNSLRAVCIKSATNIRRSAEVFRRHMKVLRVNTNTKDGYFVYHICDRDCKDEVDLRKPMRSHGCFLRVWRDCLLLSKSSSHFMYIYVYEYIYINICAHTCIYIYIYI